MKTTNFEVKNRKIERIDFTTHTGEYNVDTFKFKFDEEWNELDKTLVIVVNNKTYNIAILKDEAILPKEAYVDSQRISIGVFGKKEDTLLASNLIEIWMTEGAYKEGEEPENLPTPTQWDLYIQEINAIVNQVEELTTGLDNKVAEVENKLANGDFKGEKGETGPQGPQGIQGPQGEQGETGYTPQKGVDYYTETEKQEFVKEVLAALPIAEEVEY